MARPNILIFMTDQQRGDTMPQFGRAHMPNLERFCEQGVTFTSTWCPSPHCCPSRATLFSGLYPSQHGVWNNVNVGNTLSRGLFAGVRLFSDDLAAAGYRLHYSGKWHVSDEETPQERGWTMGWPAYREPKRGKQAHPDPYEWAVYDKLAGQPEPVKRGEGEILRPGYPRYIHYASEGGGIVNHDENTVADAVRTIAARPAGDAPWCQYVGTLGPHDPYFVPAKYLDLYPLDSIRLPANFGDAMADKPALYRRTRDRFDQLTEREQRQALRHYLAFCTYQDELFGRVLAALEAKGELDNTLVVYCSDHGDYAGDHGLWCKGLPCFDGAYHVPLAIRWPGGVKQPGRAVDAFCSLADLAPTFLEAAGVKADRAFAGRSLLPWLAGQTPTGWRDAVYTQSNGNELYGIQRSIRTRDWKYVYNGFDYDELYALANDPGETRNLAGLPAYAEVVRDLCGRMWRFAHEHDDVCINPYIMVAHAPVGPAAGLDKRPAPGQGSGQ